MSQKSSFCRGARRRAPGSVLIGGVAMLAALAPAPLAAQAQQAIPSYMDIIVGATVPDAATTARDNVVAINTGMFTLYDDASRLVQASILERHPVILGLFSGAGGRFILYRPGQPPLEAPQVPEVYQLLKSVGHSVMAIAVAAGPHIGKPTDGSWQPQLLAYRARLKAALDSLDQTTMPQEWRANNRALIEENIAFIDRSVAAGVITFPALQAFAATQKDRLKLNIRWAADTQVKHWMGVIAGWKQMLGPDWDKVYAASNTIYVARQNNVLFSVLAQFFKPEDINARLILIETVSFTTTPQDMLTALTRIISDRTVGETFFGSRYLMDYELMGGDARDSIVAETKARGIPTHLPPKVPFGSNQWPALITAGPGAASLADLP